MQTVDHLNEEFAVEDHLRFDEPYPGMPRARVSTPVCRGEVYLHGGHLTQWQPIDAEPVLFLSERSAFVPEKAIRGGIPVIFPWFGAAENSPVETPPGSGSHGFARVSPWTLRFAALAGDDLHLSLTLDDTEQRKKSGFASLRLGIDIVLGKTLTARLSAANASQEPDASPFLFEEALHAYLQVGDVEQVSIEGLGNTDYLDKTEAFRRKTQSEPLLRIAGEVDRPYLNTTAAVTLHDPAWQRRLHLTKAHSDTTVIWNPAPELSAKLPDLRPDDWQQFVCIETANAAQNAVTLPPGQMHVMTMNLAVERL